MRWLGTRHDKRAKVSEGVPSIYIIHILINASPHRQFSKEIFIFDGRVQASLCGELLT